MKDLLEGLRVIISLELDTLTVLFELVELIFHFLFAPALCQPLEALILLVLLASFISHRLEAQGVFFGRNSIATRIRIVGSADSSLFEVEEFPLIALFQFVDASVVGVDAELGVEEGQGVPF